MSNAVGMFLRQIEEKHYEADLIARGIPAVYYFGNEMPQ